MATVTNVWNVLNAHRQEPGARAFLRVGQESDLMLALNYYEPGYEGPFHHHCGTSQSYLVLQGEMTLRTRYDESEPAEEHRLGSGDCALIATGEYYQLANEGDAPMVLYQAKQPTDKVQLLGHEPVNAREHFGDVV